MIKEIVEKMEVNEAKYGKSVKALAQYYLQGAVEYDDAFTENVESYIDEDIVAMYAKENKLDLTDEEVDRSIHGNMISDVRNFIDKAIEKM